MTRPKEPNADAQPAPPAEAGEPNPALTADDLEQLKLQAAKAAEHWDQLLRTTADFDNFKKRAARERQEAITYANTGLLQKLIPILDNFEAALAAVAGAQDASAQSLQTGVSMIASQLRSALAESGLEEIDAAGKPFDPALHEAVSQQETDEVTEGHVVQQLRKGYKLRDRLLRPATVIVARPSGQA